MAYTTYIAYTLANPFPQTPRPGENAGKEDVPKDGDAIFSIQSDDPVLTNGNRGDDIAKFYEVVEGPALRAFNAAEVEAVLLPERKKSLVAYTWDLAVEKRRAITQPPEGVSEGALASYNQSLTGRAAAKIRRENQGRSKPVEDTELQDLETQADALETVDNAMLAITTEIQGASSGSLPTEEEIKNDSRWTG